MRKENQKRKSRKREGAGISACSFLAVGNAYKHSDWRLTMKKMFVIAGVLAAIAGVATAVCRSRKKYAQM